MSKTWFTSDTHFGHHNIIRYCSRPFGSTEEMDGELVARWNSVVSPHDEIWHLGDFVHRGQKSPGDYLRLLNGRKNLVWGNHDNSEARTDPGWASSQAMAEIKVDGQRIVLLHYALRVWPRSHHGALHLYGHSHGNLPGDRQSLDVGVDCWDYRPVSLTKIRARLATLPERVPVDHHGRNNAGEG
ncbi:metallophosphoesterase family protein [Roseomonas sp. BN140053]|uniref:metallophosphoesterase family protein n=1 Tax=Roseomonas sp. BN140053 TaxID=3391898 RepID=UPI0039EC341C